MPGNFVCLFEKVTLKRTYLPGHTRLYMYQCRLLRFDDTLSTLNIAFNTLKWFKTTRTVQLSWVLLIRRLTINRVKLKESMSDTWRILLAFGTVSNHMLTIPYIRSYAATA